MVERGQALARSLLDGARPVDTAVRLAVDAALRHRSTDRTVHAAALLLAFSVRADLGLNRSKANGWMLGLDELVDCGHLDAAAYAVPRLNKAFPRQPYLEYMALVFRQLPAAVGNGRQPFLDDRDNDVQMVPMPGADTIVIAFCGVKGRLGLSTNLMDRWFAQLDSHVIYLRDRKKAGYTGGIPALGRNMETTVEGLRKLVRDVGARRVVCTGNSAGASGALRYARALGAERVLALAPITGGQDFVRKIALSLPTGGVMPWTDLVPLYREDIGVRARIMYGEKNAGDKQEALRMAGLPNVTVEALRGWESHHLVGGLLQAGRLERVLGWLTSVDDVPDVDGLWSSPTQSALT